MPARPPATAFFLVRPLLAAAVLLVLLPDRAAAKCPNLAAYRSPRVTDGGFDPARLAGLWYESAFIDIAQVGASCQTLNATYHEDSGQLVMPFAVKYGPIPFTIVEVYNPQNATGMYLKHVNEPGGKLLQLDTVIVDVTAADDTSPYETLSMISCVDVAGINVQEVIFAQRNPLDSSNNATLQAMENTARSLGAEWDASKLKTVDFSKC